MKHRLGEKKQVEALLSGGEVNAGPPLGPALGPLGVNVLQIVNRINELTKAYSGMKVPVRVVVDIETKEFEVEIGTPTTSALVVKELGIQKGSGNPKAEFQVVVKGDKETNYGIVEDLMTSLHETQNKIFSLVTIIKADTKKE